VAGTFHHRPVLERESLTALALRPGMRVLDGTVGGGGHAEAILELIGPDGSLIGLDVDPEALAAAAARLARFEGRVRLEHASFRELRRVLDSLSIDRIDAVLLDLGVSSRQIDAPERGFRFSEDTAEMTPLDMRMDPRLTTSAADLLAHASAAEIARWLREYGEVEGAERLARAIDAARRDTPLRTVRELLRLIDRAGVGRHRRHHPATLVFQALRIAVNDELGTLAEGLDAALEAVARGGRIAVIAYHSLEDRLVKQRFRAEARGCTCPPRQPVCTCGRFPRVRLVTTRAIRASDGEVRSNPRARSARLRVVEKRKEAA
jgi:16S rRNA (cytosine1402-N4)-methyltransferase